MESKVHDLSLGVRTAFAHAALHVLAEEAAVDLLHIKGWAISPSVSAQRRSGTDADVLVRPSHASALLDTLERHGWETYSTFLTGSAFDHAATVRHQLWGFADVHRLFPGITVPPEAAFSRLWEDRTSLAIAGIGCAVPSATAQMMLLVLNAARSAAHGAGDLQLWHRVEPEQRAAVLELVGQLGADVAFAAATGDLERYRGRREYELWRVTIDGGTRFEEWAARVRAQPTRAAAARVAVRALLVNSDHLTDVLGRAPTRPEIVREFFARPLRGVIEQIRQLVRRRS